MRRTSHLPVMFAQLDAEERAALLEVLTRDNYQAACRAERWLAERLARRYVAEREEVAR